MMTALGATRTNILWTVYNVLRDLAVPREYYFYCLYNLQRRAVAVAVALVRRTRDALAHNRAEPRSAELCVTIDEHTKIQIGEMG